VVPGLLDFCIFIATNTAYEYPVYGGSYLKHKVFTVAKNYFIGKQKDLIAAIREHGCFRTLSDFEHTETLVKGYIDKGAKMGEGWLLTAEMLELAENGCLGIVCTQPFGCLPNHVCGKGMMKPIKERNPGINIVAIDYDTAMSVVNQENRIKLMLSSAKEEMERRKEKTETTV
jgi:predicted nucleotide-binding protein (sugar kinase/HSP70/actin superfamily)